MFLSRQRFLSAAVALFLLAGCSTTYKAKPLPFRAPSTYPNAQEAGGAIVGAETFVDSKSASEAFGFNIRGAGLLPVQVVFDNQGVHPLEIVPSQTFLEDREGRLWPVLQKDVAYERVSKFAETKRIFKEGAYSGFLGGAAGAVIGAAIGIVSGSNIAEAAGKGAAVGAGAGATAGGIKAYASDDARREIVSDLNRKSLQNQRIEPQGLAFGFLFFPGEAPSAALLRMQVKEVDTGRIHLLLMSL
jgi:hypothetical protein